VQRFIQRALALSLSLALAAPAAAQTTGAPLAAPEMVWPALETWLSEQAGVPSDPASIPLLRQETAELLRNEPGRPLESIVAQAYATTRSLDATRAQPLELALRAVSRFTKLDEADGSPLIVVREKVYAARAAGYFEKVAQAWRKVEDPQTLHELELEQASQDRSTEFESKDLPADQPYISTKGRLYRQEGDRAVPVSAPVTHKRAYHILPNGLWKLSPEPPDGWRDSVTAHAASEAAAPPASEGEVRLEQGPDRSIVDRGRAVFSAIASKLGGAFPAPAEDADKHWDGMAAWLGRAGGGTIDVQAWRKETAALLRSQPDLRLEQALAESAVKAGRLDPVRSERFSRLLKTDWQGLANQLEEAFGTKIPVERWKEEATAQSAERPEKESFVTILARSASRAAGLGLFDKSKFESLLSSGGMYPFLEVDAGGSLHRAAAWNGKIYVASYWGLYSWNGKEWIKDSSDVFRGFVVEWAGALGGRLYASASNKLYVREGPGWKLVFEAPNVPPRYDGSVQYAARIGGRLYIGTETSVHVLGGPKPVRIELPGSVKEIHEADGRILAATGKGVFVLEGNSARRLGTSSDWAHFAKKVGGKVYVGTNLGLFEDRDGVRTLELTNTGCVRDLVELDGKLYASTSIGPWVKEADGWRPASNYTGSVNHIYEFGGKRYVMTAGQELFQWTPKRPTPPEAWRRILLESLASDTDAAEAAQPATEGTGLRSEAGGIVKAGRTIFRALLSKLGSAFPKPAEEEPLWAGLDGWISEASGKTWRTPAAEWRQEAGRLLRNEPGLPVELALARSFAKLHTLTPEQAGLVERLLTRSEAPVRGLPPSVSYVSLLDGEIYASAGSKVFLLKGLAARPLPADAASERIYFRLAEEFEGVSLSASIGIRDGERHYTRQPNGEVFAEFLPKSLPASWKSAVSVELAPSPAEAAQTDEKPEALETDGQNGILKAGRTIFSNLISKLGSAFSAKAEPDPLSGLSAWVKEALGIRLQPRAWLRAAAAELRSRPDLRLEEALARGAARSAGLSDADRERIEELLSDPDGVVTTLRLPDNGKMLRGVVEFEGKVYAGGGQGVFVRKGNDWIDITPPQLKGRQIDWFGVLDGRLSAATPGWLYIRGPRGWKPGPRLPDSTISQVERIDGTLYVSCFEGLFEVGDTLRRLTSPGRTRIDGFAKVGQEIWAAGTDGILRLKSGRTETIRDVPGWHRSIKELGDKVYVGSDKGLLVYDGADWTIELAGTGSVGDIAEVEGRLLAATDRGPFLKVGLGWKPLGRKREIARRVLRAGGRTILLSGDTIREWAPKPAGLSANWKKEALEGLGLELEKHSEKSHAEKGASLKQGAEGGVTDGRGRTIFSKLISKLGSGFGETAPSKPDAWSTVAARLAGWSGVPADGLDVEAFRRHAVVALRGAPGADLEAALIEAFAASQRLSPEAAESARERLGRVPTPVLSDRRFTTIRVAGGVLRASSEQGLLVQDGGSFRDEWDSANDVIEFRGEVYAATMFGLMRRGPEGAWNAVPGAGGSVFRVFELDGKLLGDVDNGLSRLMRLEDGGWKAFEPELEKVRKIERVGEDLYAIARGRLVVIDHRSDLRSTLLSKGWVYDFLSFDGSLFVATAHGVYRMEADGSYKQVLEGNALALAVVDGRLWASTGHGIFELEGGDWRPVSGLMDVRQIVSANGSQYLITPSTLYRWTRRGGLLTASELEAVLSEIGTASEAKPKESGELQATDHGIEKDGKTVFSR
jgi:hypothetical protein